jgi:hypothetical protein
MPRASVLWFLPFTHIKLQMVLMGNAFRCKICKSKFNQLKNQLTVNHINSQLIYS